MISQQELQERLNYDPKSGLLTWKVRPESTFANKQAWAAWNTRFSNKPAFTTINGEGYRIGSINNVVMSAARVIYTLMTGTEPEMIDHIDGNRTNDSWVNLRNVDAATNLKNKKKSIANKSGVTGVCWDKARNKWEATIGHNRKSIKLGYFECINDAITARKLAEIEYNYHPNHGR